MPRLTIVLNFDHLEINPPSKSSPASTPEQSSGQGANWPQLLRETEGTKALFPGTQEGMVSSDILLKN